MTQTAIAAVGRPEIEPRPISTRLRGQLVYFMTAADTPDVPALGEGEYWIAAANVDAWLDEGVLHLVSPLDTANTVEVELSQEQEELLHWLHSQRIQHIRVIE